MGFVDVYSFQTFYCLMKQLLALLFVMKLNDLIKLIALSFFPNPILNYSVRFLSMENARKTKMVLEVVSRR
jgi:hypothetical protein